MDPSSGGSNNGKDDKSSFNWLLWTGVGFGGVIVIALIIVFAVKGSAGAGGMDEDEGTSL